MILSSDQEVQKMAQKAANELKSKFPKSNSTLTAVELDITNASSVEKFQNWVKNERGKIDVLVNNAGVGYTPNSKEENLSFLSTNFNSTVSFTEKLLPQLTDDAKIIMLSSGLGRLSHQGEKARKLLEDSSLTGDRLIQIAKEVYDDTNNGKKNQLGFIDNLYYASKALLNAYTRWALVKMLKGEQQCYTVAPGWCRTDKGGSVAPRSVEQGADTPIYLINLPFKRDDKLNGKFIEDQKVVEF